MRCSYHWQSLLEAVVKVNRGGISPLQEVSLLLCCWFLLPAIAPFTPFLLELAPAICCVASCTGGVELSPVLVAPLEACSSMPISAHGDVAGLRLLLTNAFGLRNKFGDFQHVVSKYDIDIAIVTETKYSAEAVTLADAVMPGYCPPYRLDRDGNGGGVAVWVRSGIPSVEVTGLPTNGHELLWISVRSTSGSNILVGALYRPGSASPTDTTLIDHLDETLSGELRYDNIIIAGDFNVHNTEWLHSTKTTLAGEALEDMCAVHGLTQHVQERTRGTATLDLVLSNFTDSVESSLLPPLGKSDHAVVVCHFPNGTLRRDPPASRTIWRYNRADWSRMRASLRGTDWSSVIGDNPQEACQKFTDIVCKAMQQYIPNKAFNISSSDPTWWTPECAQSMAEKERCWRQRRKEPGNENHKSSFTQSVARAAAVLSRSRRDGLSKVREKLSSRSLTDKEWWTGLKAACGEGRCHELPLIVGQDGTEYITSAEKAEAFAAYFSQKCSLGDSDFRDGDLADIPTPEVSSLALIHFRSTAVRRILSGLDVSKATGPDGISTRVLKECAKELAGPLTRLFSLCFRSGIQPDAWKVAYVVPVHKKSSRSVLANYRPVSLLCITSKVMESIINRQVTNHLEKNHLLTDHQFGFRKNLGTADVLCSLHHAWSGIVGRGGAARVLAVDIAGAFDKVSHYGVLRKAGRCGISGPLLNWLGSYLANRSLCCVTGGRRSQPYPVGAGVPQGSILGPTLFLIYVNDAPDCLTPGTSLEAYADDNTLYTLVSSVNNLPESADSLQRAVDGLDRWGAKWKVKFEPRKSQAMTISLHRNQWDIPPISFGTATVPESSEMKLLGVIFDSKLTFASHLRSIAVKARQRLGLLRRAAGLLDPKGRAAVYRGFVRPLMEYAPLVWMGAAPSHLSRLDRVQERAASIIGPDVQLPSLGTRRLVAGLSYLYKLQTLERPGQLKNIIPPFAVPPANPRTRAERKAAGGHRYQLSAVLPVRAPDMLRRAFPHSLISQWNALPPSLFQSQPTPKGLDMFKRNVNRHLMRQQLLL